MRLDPGIRLILLVMCVLVLVPAAIVGYLGLRSAHATRQIPAVKEKCKPIVEELERMLETQGRCPAVLTEKQKTVLNSFSPPVQYSVAEDAKSCDLAYGDYLLDGFTLYWDSRDRAWHEDH